MAAEGERKRREMGIFQKSRILGWSAQVCLHFFFQRYVLPELKATEVFDHSSKNETPDYGIAFDSSTTKVAFKVR